MEFLCRNFEHEDATSNLVEPLRLNALVDEVGALAQTSSVHDDDAGAVCENEFDHAYGRKSVILLAVFAPVRAGKQGRSLWTRYEVLVLDVVSCFHAAEQERGGVDSGVARHGWR